jgi:hypothetical protein
MIPPLYQILDFPVQFYAKVSIAFGDILVLLMV